MVITETAIRPHEKNQESMRHHPAWQFLKNTVSVLRSWQAPDGSIDFSSDVSPPPDSAHDAVERMVEAVQTLSPLFPYDALYHEALIADLRRWAAGGFHAPDFLDSLLAFRPGEQRIDGLRHFVVFPMYTQNGNPDRNMEAVLFRVVWPDWVSELENSRYDNRGFLSTEFEDFTAGYDTHAAVLFPETVSARKGPGRFDWGAIFCDREAARFCRVTQAAIEATSLNLPQDAQDLLDDRQRAQEAFVLWDLIHDRTHSHGDLPFDPFMIKQRQPFWMYGIEELRCDLTAFHEAGELAAEGLQQQGKDLQYTVLFDRIFRFPVTGDRHRNYDGLGGQLLFAYLHQHDALRWTDNRLTIDWDGTREACGLLLQEINALYKKGIDRPKTVHWLKVHAFISSHLEPHPGSAWARGAAALDFSASRLRLIDSALPDEFPLSLFYEALAKKLRPVIESTRGITAGDGFPLNR